MVHIEPAGSRRWWRRKGAGRCPLPRLFRRCVGWGLAAVEEVAAATARVIFPFAAQPPSDPRPRGSTRESIGAMRANWRRSCGSSPRRGCDWGWDCHPTMRCPFGAALGVQASEVLLETPAEVPGPFPTLASTGRSAEDLGVPRGAAAGASAGGYRTRVQEAAGRNGWSRGFTWGRLERGNRNPLHSGHRLQSDSRGGD